MEPVGAPDTQAASEADAAVRVVLLGTGTPNPDPLRCGSGTAIVHASGWWLVDCGRGVPQRILEAGLDLSELAGVLLTHHHSDHVSDLAALATLRWVGGSASPLVVVAPDGPCARFAERCLDGFDDQAFHGQARADVGPRPDVDVRPFEAEPEPALAALGSAGRIRAVAVDHGPIEAAVGYRVEIAGRSVVVSGDTAVCDGMVSLAAGADLLVHEALLSDRVPSSALTWNAGAGPVGRLAQQCGVGHLVLTHLIPAPAGATDEQAFVDEARAGGYDGPITVARDLIVVDVGVGGWS